jgi:hypothetical protein
MTLIVCLDDRLGMMFNRRRQSRDRVLIDELMTHVGKRRLVISPYSAPLFPNADSAPNLIVSDAPWSEAKEDDVVFAEDIDPVAAWDRLTEVVIYRWNRAYPADRHFKGDLTKLRLCETKEFVGSSHEKITKEVWKL